MGRYHPSQIFCHYKKSKNSYNTSHHHQVGSPPPYIGYSRHITVDIEGKSGLVNGRTAENLNVRVCVCVCVCVYFQCNCPVCSSVFQCVPVLVSARESFACALCVLCVCLVCA